MLRFLAEPAIVKKVRELPKNGVDQSRKDREMDYHQKAYICIHVFEKTRPVLLVSRPEGDWCFLCGDVHEDDVSAIRIVGIGHLVEYDPTLAEVLDLEPDWDAERNGAGAKWIRSPGTTPYE